MERRQLGLSKRERDHLATEEERRRGRMQDNQISRGIKSLAGVPSWGGWHLSLTLTLLHLHPPPRPGRRGGAPQRPASTTLHHQTGISPLPCIASPSTPGQRQRPRWREAPLPQPLAAAPSALHQRTRDGDDGFLLLISCYSIIWSPAAASTRASSSPTPGRPQGVR